MKLRDVIVMSFGDHLTMFSFRSLQRRIFAEIGLNESSLTELCACKQPWHFAPPYPYARLAEHFSCDRSLNLFCRF